MKYIALLRGINVGGHKKFIKVEQLEMLKKLKYNDVQVYLHTGNWIFSSEDDTAIISKKISAAINKQFGWDVPVLVLKDSKLLDIFKVCPFPEVIKEKSYFTLLKEKPNPDCIAELKKYTYPNEAYHYSDSCVYFYPALGAGKAKMSNNFFENKLKVTATTRNYRTMAKLIAMVENN